MKKIILSVLFSAYISLVFCKIELSPLLSSGMVLQQKSNVKLWGMSNVNAKVKISTLWNKKAYSTVSDQTGKWQLTITTEAAGGPYFISISDGEELRVENVMLGEV